MAALCAVEVHATSSGQGVGEFALGAVCKRWQVRVGLYSEDAADDRPPNRRARRGGGSLTNAILLKIHRQALGLVFRVVGAFPVLKVLTAPTSVLLLPLP